MLEKDGSPLRQFGYVPGQDGPEHFVTIPEVIVNGGSVPLVCGTNDFRNWDVVHATLGEEARRCVQKEVARRDRLGHGNATVIADSGRPPRRRMTLTQPRDPAPPFRGDSEPAG
jgi:hypothetical protein